MGGFGSGRYYHWSSRVTTEECKRIDIRWLKQNGYMVTNTRGSLSWTSRGKPSGGIGYTMLKDKMVLNYKYQANDDDWQSIEETIHFVLTRCNYGGTRQWFLCPGCGRRVAILYLWRGLFTCRKCAHVVYGSQQESELDRLARKAKKIRHKMDIGDTELYDPDRLFDGTYWKPKNMHWKTFNRLKQAENRIRDRINDDFLAKYGFMM